MCVDGQWMKQQVISSTRIIITLLLEQPLRNVKRERKKILWRWNNEDIPGMRLVFPSRVCLLMYTYHVTNRILLQLTFHSHHLQCENGHSSMASKCDWLQCMLSEFSAFFFVLSEKKNTFDFILCSISSWFSIHLLTCNGMKKKIKKFRKKVKTWNVLYSNKREYLLFGIVNCIRNQCCWSCDMRIIHVEIESFAWGSDNLNDLSDFSF